jgi:glycosyltransferase involved in cell wall biosynthesis
MFTGFRNDVPRILNAIDILVLPSQREGFPMTVLEAMAAGKPVIASSIDGVNESVVNGVSGLLVPPRDAPALAKAILSLITDGDKRRRLGLAGRKEVVDKFSITAMIHAHERVYDGLLNESGR